MSQNKNSNGLKKWALISIAILMPLILLQNTLGQHVPFLGSLLASLILFGHIYLPIKILETFRCSFKDFYLHGYGLESSLDFLWGQKTSSVNWQRLWRDVWFTFKFSFFILAPYALLFASMFAQNKGFFNFQYDKPLFKEVLIQLFAVALPEEFFYRGFLQNALQKRDKSSVETSSFLKLFSKPVILTNVFFAVSHIMGPFAPIRLLTFFPGLLFSYLALRTKSIVAPVIFHALCNLLGQLLFFSFLK